jgi:hypothetical protein
MVYHQTIILIVFSLTFFSDSSTFKKKTTKSGRRKIFQVSTDRCPFTSRIIMPKNDASPEGRSQKLTLPDMVAMDGKTYRNLMRLIGNSIDTLENVRHREVMITSLQHHLSELEDSELATSLEVNKALLLVELWLEVCPDYHTEIASELQHVFYNLNLVLTASQLGGDK